MSAGQMDRGVRLDGGQERDYNHSTDSQYHNLRKQADQAYQKRSNLSQQSQQAYKLGDKARAHQLSEEAKKQLEIADDFNGQAAEYVFRENNADSSSNEIDLHGLYVKEAVYILRKRIDWASQHNQSQLRVIVGKGLHSANGVAKIKPAVEELCEQSNLKHYIDHKNAGVLVIELDPGAPNMPQAAYHSQQQPQYGNAQSHAAHNNNYNQQQNNNGSNDLVTTLFKILCQCINSK
ncbi:hypothetical protein BABINDRAFT_159360 [Babjeviella inositovora NRRL Y-12698]|uniref:Smr domain-containing protein n=1 Tax=Babjeviella inositovora NRRL Y-12698 TaxID=984486 RepID=A0A1E3R0G4_9ASCO|nr:uncharacterized protein BABINDRAFT_159360 [Babjeviella inositovora NRRL Y-12698]ODQ82862.1 hypothetical protein BABINDRAFT_159360 [Babjeviella inositovora NRRL Y-12698]